MRQTKLEITDPAHWLRALAQERDGYRRLVLESRGTARAAYRLARAHCNGDVPLLADLQAAAALLAARLGGQSSLPIQSLLPAPISAVMLRAAPISTPASSLPSSRPPVQPSLRSVPPPAPASPRKSRPEASRASF